MKIQFDYLPDIVLERVFQLIRPEELIDLSFLSKYLFSIIKRVIRSNLAYSLYSDGRFDELQVKFIQENGKLMKELLLDDQNIGFIKNCLNLKCINIIAFYQSYDTIPSNINIELPKLTKLSIDFCEVANILECFSNYLSQMEIIIIGVNSESIKDVVKHLNPNKLRSLEIACRELFFNLDGLDIIKSKFNKLEKLELLASKSFFTTAELNPKLNFNSNLELSISGKFENGVGIQSFGDLKKLKSIQLRDLSRNFFNDNDNIKFIEGSNITSLGYSNSGCLLSYEFFKSPALKEIHIKKFKKEVLKGIQGLPNIQMLHISKIALNEINLNYLNLDFYKCKYVKKISINNFNTTIGKLLTFIKLFPNLELINVSCLTLQHALSEIEYLPTTLILLVTRIDPVTSLGAYRRLKSIPKLNLIEL
ncbi:hypothetical protein K502DRAFT_329098 [Neoconidiobolus thromboides FSU 785]|nr:hypothetical protein K502DRAFT_329098 [Neoconidiobolus thromboides FSU 785]